MTADNEESEKSYEKHAWIILFVVSLLTLLFGLGDMISGGDADPAISESITGEDWEELKTSQPKIAKAIDLQIRIGGAALFTYGLLSMVVILTGFRCGEKWAWYALWSLPILAILIFLIFFTADRAPDRIPPPPLLSAPIFLLISVIGLLLPYRKFFPKGE